MHLVLLANVDVDVAVDVDVGVSYLSLDFQLLSGSSYLFLSRIVVVQAFEFESYDAPLFRLSLIENERTGQGHAAFGLFQFLF